MSSPGTSGFEEPQTLYSESTERWTNKLIHCSESF